MEGLVQSVGYLPFIHRLATAHNLKGFCLNSTRGLIIEVEGLPPAVSAFGRRIKRNHPPLARISRIRSGYLPVRGSSKFAIKESRFERDRSTLVSPDICVCAD